MVPIPEFNSWLVPKHATTGLRLGYHNVTLGTATILKCQCVVCSQPYLDILNHFGMVFQCDGRTDEIAIAIAASNTLDAPKSFAKTSQYVDGIHRRT